MNNRDLYKNVIKELTDSLWDTVHNFSEGHRTVNEHYNSKQLFSLTNDYELLIKNISSITNYQITRVVVALCKEIAIANGLAVTVEDIKNIDFVIDYQDTKIGYHVSINEIYMPELYEAKEKGINKYVNIVLKTALMNLKPNSYKYRNYTEKEMVANITLKDFFDNISPDEYLIFEEYIEQFNQNAKLILGLNITPVATKTALDKKRDKIEKEFFSYFFEDCILESFTETEFKELKALFVKNNVLKNSKTPFLDSFISSEWYFDLMVGTDGDLEQTAIVAGYLKSVEQLLFSMMLSKCDKLSFKLYGKKGTDKEGKLVVLSEENHSSLLTMAGNLLTSIDKNYGDKNKLDQVYINKTIGQKIQTFLHNFFKHTRNGYFHKDNIYDLDEINRIRTEAYVAYFLLGSAYKFDFNKINKEK